MRTYLFIFALILSIVTSCKSNKETTNTSSNENVSSSTSKVQGKVSHQYRATGCSTIVIISESGSEIILIPNNKFASEFDVDGLYISFDYITLRMPQPEGCSAGIPAELSNITKKNK